MSLRQQLQVQAQQAESHDFEAPRRGQNLIQDSPTIKLLIKLKRVLLEELFLLQFPGLSFGFELLHCALVALECTHVSVGLD